MSPISLCSQYTYYKYENGDLKPVQAFVTPFNNDNDKKSYLKEYILGLIHFKGYLTIEDKGIVDETFQPYYDYTPAEIIGTLEELQKDKILKLKGNRLCINY